MTFEARRATLDMADVIAAIHVQSWQAAHAGIVPQSVLDGLSVSEAADSFRRRAANRVAEYYLFSDNRVPAGIAALHADSEGREHTGEIGAIYFLPVFWGKGCGADAMRFCLDRLKAMGHSAATVWVLEENLRARRFYEKMGFSLTGDRKEVTIGDPLWECRYARPV